jgi:molecular chaperone DnaK (HSP70)
MRKIGIDFGTTNSGAGYFEQGHLRDTAESHGVTQAAPSPAAITGIPTMVAYSQGEYRFGIDALRASLDDSGRHLIIAGLKSKLGRSPEIRIGAEFFKTDDVARRFLTYLLEQLFGAGGPRTDTSAVIGTPVMFPASHRHALREAARSAGLARVEFVYEPTAALFFAIHNHSKLPEGPVAVLDWGGGTVDITIVRCHANPLRIEDFNVAARPEGFGGRNLDEAILDRVLDRSSKARAWLASVDQSTKNRVLNRLEQEKIKYLNGGKLVKGTRYLPSDAPTDVQTDFRPSETDIDTCLRAFLGKVRLLAIEATNQAGLTVEEVDHFLLVGGLAVSPAVREGLEDIWPNAREIPLAAEFRQRATTRGCALLSEFGFELALSGDIVVRQANGLYHHVLRNGQPFPRDGTGFRYQEYTYSLTDLSAQQAVFEIGHAPSHGVPVPLEILTVPVLHATRADDRSVIPFDVHLRVGLNEHLFLQATALGKCLNGHSMGHYVQEVQHRVELSRIPMTLYPGTEGDKS